MDKLAKCTLREGIPLDVPPPKKRGSPQLLRNNYSSKVFDFVIVRAGEGHEQWVSQKAGKAGDVR